eukprot:scaffold2897_cov171-Ochromonas_danica.AAC.2
MYAELSYRLPGRALVDLRTAPNEPGGSGSLHLESESTIGIVCVRDRERDNKSDSESVSERAAATVIRENDLHNLELAAVESLSDLVANNVFLPALFATFDCGTFAIDLLQPFVQLLARCASTMKTTQQSVLDDAHTTTKKIFSSARRCELFMAEASAMFDERP